MNAAACEHLGATASVSASASGSPNQSAAMPFDILIIGAGIRGSWQLTREAERALASANAIFCSVYNAGMSDYIRSINGTAPIAFEEDNEYRPGMYRPHMYQRMADRVVSAARDHSGVVVLHPGSALVVDLVTQGVLDAARDAGLTVNVMPGISAVEAVLAAVDYDVSDGLQIALAQKLVLRRLVLDPGQGAIILQPAYYDTHYFAGTPRSRETRFELLQQALARTWNVDAPAALVTAPMEIGEVARVFWLRIGRLQHFHDLLSPLHTLFIPPVQLAPDDAGFADRIASWPALLEHVVTDEHGALAQLHPDEVFSAPLAPAADLAAESSELAHAWQARRRV